MTISRTRTAALASLPLAVLAGFVAATPAGDDAVARPLVLVAAGGGAGDNGNGKNVGGGNDGKIIALSGSTSGLYPGSARPLSVGARNDNNFALRLDRMSAAVGAPKYPDGTAASGCTAAMASVDAFTVGITLPANSTTQLPTQVRLVAGATNACKRAVFPLTYTATASKK